MEKNGYSFYNSTVYCTLCFCGSCCKSTSKAKGKKPQKHSKFSILIEEAEEQNEEQECENNEDTEPQSKSEPVPKPELEPEPESEP